MLKNSLSIFLTGRGYGLAVVGLVANGHDDEAGFFHVTSLGLETDARLKYVPAVRPVHPLRPPVSLKFQKRIMPRCLLHRLVRPDRSVAAPTGPGLYQDAAPPVADRGHNYEVPLPWLNKCHFAGRSLSHFTATVSKP